MTIENLTAALVLITAFYAFVTYRMMRVNQQVLVAMQEQADAASRPYVMVTVFTEPNSSLFYLRIANTGRTGAKRLRLALDKDFHQYGQRNRTSLREVAAFSRMIEEFPPGAEMIFGLAQGFVVLAPDADPAITPQVFSIEASYSYGANTVVERTTIDLRPYRDSMDPPSAIADELKKLREELHTVATSVEGLAQKADSRR